MLPRTQLGKGRRWRVRSKSRGCGGLWEDEWTTASCAGALATSLAEETAVLWSGHVEMNYTDGVAEVRLMDLSWSTGRGEAGNK